MWVTYSAEGMMKIQIWQAQSSVRCQSILCPAAWLLFPSMTSILSWKLPSAETQLGSIPEVKCCHTTWGIHSFSQHRRGWSKWSTETVTIGLTLGADKVWEIQSAADLGIVTWLLIWLMLQYLASSYFILILVFCFLVLLLFVYLVFLFVCFLTPCLSM
jgi:hypothetical protein